MLGGNSNGVLGYVLSRYKAIANESAITAPVEGSWMMGSV